jgi:transcription antitermination factor NusG
MFSRTTESRDTFLFPRDLFDREDEAATTFWTCARSKPRWEKKLAEYLGGREIPYYMPVAVKDTFSGRKRRSTAHPLFPGFVFVQGNYDKSFFKASASVAYVLRPRSPVEAAALDKQIRAVRRVLTETSFVELSTIPQIGERVTIASGTLTGLTGNVTTVENTKRIIVWVDMLGVGVSVALGPDVAWTRAAEVQADVGAATRAS